MWGAFLTNPQLQILLNFRHTRGITHIFSGLKYLVKLFLRLLFVSLFFCTFSHLSFHTLSALNPLVFCIFALSIYFSILHTLHTFFTTPRDISSLLTWFSLIATLALRHFREHRAIFLWTNPCLVGNSADNDDTGDTRWAAGKFHWCDRQCSFHPTPLHVDASRTRTAAASSWHMTWRDCRVDRDVYREVSWGCSSSAFCSHLEANRKISNIVVG